MKLSYKEIIEKGSRILIRELGYSGFLRFIRQIENNGDDYLQLQEDLYRDKLLDELYNEAKDKWDCKNE